MSMDLSLRRKVPTFLQEIQLYFHFAENCPRIATHFSGISIANREQDSYGILLILRSVRWNDNCRGKRIRRISFSRSNRSLPMITISRVYCSSRGATTEGSRSRWRNCWGTVSGYDRGTLEAETRFPEYQFHRRKIRYSTEGAMRLNSRARWTWQVHGCRRRRRRLGCGAARRRGAWLYERTYLPGRTVSG